MHDIVIIFHHHRNDAVTQQNYESFIYCNPGVPVIPIACDDGLDFDPLSDAVFVPCEFSRGFNWSALDQVLSTWFRRFDVPAKRYLFVESDCYCSSPVREWYSEVWDADFAGAEIIRIQDDPNWWGFRDAAIILPWDWRQHAAATIPFNGVLLSRRAMQALAAERIEGLYCEMRLPTIMRVNGLTLTELPPEKRKTNRPDAVGRPKYPGIWHPVKEVL